jgi:spermidine synthase
LQLKISGFTSLSSHNSRKNVEKCFLLPNTPKQAYLRVRTLAILSMSMADSFSDPSGGIGFMVCCKDPERDVKEPLRSWSLEDEEKLCRYYNKEIHRASFVLPTFARKALR